MNSLKYRADIDGLRAVSVIAVMIYHATEYILPGGFLGVDIFFIISGFLITSIIQKKLVNENFSQIDFYKKRILRILPSYFSMLFFVFILSYFIDTPQESFVVMKTSIFSSSFLANIFFLFESKNYFFNAGQSPLLHTWSLSLEEQYYLFIPIILLLLYKFKKKTNIFFIILIIINIILIYYLYYKEDYNSLFYLTPARMTGLLIGSFCSVLQEKIRITNNWLNIFSFILIMFCFVLVDSHIFNPTAILVLLFSTSIIILSTSNTPINKILSSKLFVWIGKVSYSLYLFHYPVIIYFKKIFHFNFYETLLLLIMSFIPGILNHYMIENRIRFSNLNFKKSFLFCFIFPTILIIAIATTGLITNGFEFRYPNLKALTTYKLDRIKALDTTQLNTFLNPPLKNAPHFVILGDSHADHFQNFFAKVSKELKINFSILSLGNCTPGATSKMKLYKVSKENLIQCEKLLIKFKSNINKYDGVVLAGYYTDKIKNEPYLNSLRELISFITKSRKKLIFMTQIPELNANLPIRSNLLRSRYGLNIKEKINSLPEISKNNKFLLRFLNEFPLLIINLDKIFFSDQKKKFYQDHNGNVLYSDYNHLNLSGSYFLAEQFLTSKHYKKERKYFKF